MPFVLDASVSLAWAIPDEVSPYAQAAMEALRGDEALVPAIWPLEYTNGLLMAVRRGRMSEAQVARSIALALDLPLVLNGASIHATLQQVHDLATEHGLTAYDASYLDLAMREGLPLCTQDDRLQSAAQRAGVRLAEFP